MVEREEAQGVEQLQRLPEAVGAEQMALVIIGMGQHLILAILQPLQ
jgi:hypothetical protein